MPDTPLQQLSAHGQSVWIDFLSRPFVHDGDLEALVREGVDGVTSNPTIFQAAIAEGDAYDEQLREVLKNERDPKEVFLALAVDDIRAACDILRPSGTRRARTRATAGSRSRSTPTWRTTPRARSTRPSACTRSSTARTCSSRSPRPRRACRAIEETIAAGIPVNVTLIFSLERHREVAEAYIRGVQRLADAGGDLGPMASVASFFVSRVDTEADKRLDEIGGHDELKGTLAIANAKLAYETYKEVFAGERWEALARQGRDARSAACGRRRRPRTPTTATCIYVEELIGPDTVNTMPRETVEAFQDHGEVARHARARTSRARGRVARGLRRRPGSTTTTWSRRSSARAWRSSPSPSSSCSPTSRPSATRWWRHERRESPRASWASSCGSTPSASSAAAGSGHPTSSMSAADLHGGPARRRLPAARHRSDLDDPANDHLIFSKGHASPLYYAVLKAAGIDRRRGAARPSASSAAASRATPRRASRPTDVATGLARPGPADRGRRRAGRQAARPAALPRVVPVRRLRDGRGLDLGGVRARRVRGARQPDGDHRRQPPRPDARDDGRLGPRHLQAARRGVRLARDRDRRPRRRRRSTPPTPRRWRPPAGRR